MSEPSPFRANVELKARCPDREKAVEACRRLGAEYVETELQIDHYFSIGAYRLKLRESSLGRHWLIGYHRPDAPGARKSSYRLTAVPDPAAKREILARQMGVKVVVRKERTLYRLGPIRIHLDRVDDLGEFLEFEAVLSGEFAEPEARHRVEGLRREFEIAEENLISTSYSALLARESVG